MNQTYATAGMDNLLGAGTMVIEFPRARIIELLALRASADLIESQELTAAVADAESDMQLNDLTGMMPAYRSGEHFTMELNYRIDLMERAYSRDARLYQRIVGELVGGSLTPLLEEERAEHRQRFNELTDKTRENVEQVVERLAQEHAIRQTITSLGRLAELVTERDRDLRNEQQQLVAEIETQQAAGQQDLTAINEIVRRYNWLPSFLLSTQLLFRVSIFIGLVTLGIVLGSFWNVFVMVVAGGLSAALGMWLVLMRQMPGPEMIEPNLRSYYRAFGQRLFLEEQLIFWTQVRGRLDEYGGRLEEINETLRRQHHELTAQWQDLKQRLLSPPRHVMYLLNEQEIQGWFEEIHAVDNQDLLRAFRRTSLAVGSDNTVAELLQKITDQLSTRFQWKAEKRLQDLHGVRAVQFLFKDDIALLNRVFTLAVRSGKLLDPGRYHRSFFIGMNQPGRSRLAVSLKQMLRQHNLGVKFVENGDPYKITILGLEGGFTIRSLREGSELIQHFREHQYDPLIYPNIRSRQE